MQYEQTRLMMGWLQASVTASQCYAIAWHMSVAQVQSLYASNHFDHVEYAVQETTGAAELFLAFKLRTTTHTLRAQLALLGATEIMVETFGNDHFKGAGAALHRVRIAKGKPDTKGGALGTCDKTIAKRADEKRKADEREAAAGDSAETRAKTAAALRASLGELQHEVAGVGQQVADLAQSQQAEAASLDDIRGKAQSIDTNMVTIAAFSTQTQKAAEMHVEVMDRVAAAQGAQGQSLAELQQTLTGLQRSVAQRDATIAVHERTIAELLAKHKSQSAVIAKLNKERDAARQATNLQPVLDKLDLLRVDAARQNELIVAQLQAGAARQKELIVAQLQADATSHTELIVLHMQEDATRHTDVMHRVQDGQDLIRLMAREQHAEVVQRLTKLGEHPAFGEIRNLHTAQFSADASFFFQNTTANDGDTGGAVVVEEEDAPDGDNDDDEPHHRAAKKRARAL